MTVDVGARGKWLAIASGGVALSSVMTKLIYGSAGAIIGVLATLLAGALAHDSSKPVAAPVASAPPARVPCTEARTPRPPPAPKPDDSPTTALEVEVAQQAQLISSNPDGVLPAAYPPGLPDQFREPTFRGVVEGALRDCMPESKLVELSCDEPPCVAVIAQRKPTSFEDRPEPLDRCREWQRAYGRDSRTRYDVIDCGNGRKEQVQVIGPELESWPGWKDLDHAAREHIEAREWPRVKAILARHHCAS